MAVGGPARTGEPSTAVPWAKWFVAAAMALLGLAVVAPWTETRTDEGRAQINYVVDEPLLVAVALMALWWCAGATLAVVQRRGSVTPAAAALALGVALTGVLDPLVVADPVENREWWIAGSQLTLTAVVLATIAALAVQRGLDHPTPSMEGAGKWFFRGPATLVLGAAVIAATWIRVSDGYTVAEVVAIFAAYGSVFAAYVLVLAAVFVGVPIVVLGLVVRTILRRRGRATPSSPLPQPARPSPPADGVPIGAVGAQPPRKPPARDGVGVVLLALGILVLLALRGIGSSTALIGVLGLVMLAVLVARARERAGAPLIPQPSTRRRARSRRYPPELGRQLVPHIVLALGGLAVSGALLGVSLMAPWGQVSTPHDGVQDHHAPAGPGFVLLAAAIGWAAWVVVTRRRSLTGAVTVGLAAIVIGKTTWYWFGIGSDFENELASLDLGSRAYDAAFAALVLAFVVWEIARLRLEPLDPSSPLPYHTPHQQH